jgi:hypothetical protein
VLAAWFILGVTLRYAITPPKVSRTEENAPQP